MVEGRMLIDESLPVYHMVERHKIEVLAPVERVYEVVRHLDFSRSRVIRPLFWLRDLPGRWRSSGSGAVEPRLALTLDTLVRSSGFVLLGERPGREVLLGLVGRFWTPSGGTRRVTADEFRNFVRPGYAKAAWNFSVEERGESRTLLATETRVFCLDDKSRKFFLLYWTLIGPFSGLIRQEILRTAKRRSEVPAVPPVYRRASPR